MANGMRMEAAAIGELLDELKGMCDNLEVTHHDGGWRVYVYLDWHGSHVVRSAHGMIPPCDTMGDLLECLVDAHDWLAHEKAQEQRV